MFSLGNVFIMRTVLTVTLSFLFLLCSFVSAEVETQEDVADSQSEKPEKSQTTKSENNRESEKTEDSEESLDFSGTGRPGQQTAGESRGSCADAVQEPIKALLPVSYSGKTVSGHPSFWVYFPASAGSFSQVEFVIQNEAREDVWRSRSRRNFSAGYKNFSLPKTESPLKTDQWYRWYVKLYCNSQVASAQYVQGWVRRSPLSSKLHVELQNESHELHLIYGKHGIWYDAMDRLLTAYQNNPQHLTLEKDWQNLISAKGVELDNLPCLGGNYEAINY